MINRMDFGASNPGDLLGDADELRITIMRGKEGCCFTWQLSGGAGCLHRDDDEDGDPGATPEEFAALRKLIGKFERRPQLE